LAIPTSVIGTFAFMRAMGFTLNYVTLIGLSLSVGLLVDDAIVVLENIFRHVEHGEPRRVAAARATEEIGLAVTATTFSLVAVFGPIATTGGMVGRFLKQFGLTVTAAVLISLFVSFTMTPMLSARFVAVPKPNFFTRIVEKFLEWVEAAYTAILRLALRVRFVVVLLALGVLAATVYIAGRLQQEMMPAMDRGEFQITIEAPPGSSLDYTSGIVDEVLAPLQHTPGINYMVATVGGGVEQKPEMAVVTVELVDKRDRPYGLVELQTALRERYAGYTKARIAVQEAAAISVGGTRQALIQLNVRGPSLEQSEEFAEQIVERMRKVGGYADVDTTYRTGKPELGLLPDRERAYALGIPVAFLGQTLRLAEAGDKVSEFREQGETYDIRMRLAEAQRGDLGTLENLEVRSPGGQLVELRNVSRIEPGTGPLSIDRQSGQRQVTIFANLAGGKVLGTAIAELDRFAAEAVRLPGYVHDYSGQAQMMAESFRDLYTVLVLAIILIYFILAAQFESFLHPLTIMVSLPLSVIGGVGALLLTGNSMSLLSMIGFVMLMGLVTKNAILLVDFAIQGQSRGLPANEAVLQAGRIRLRPILMTTAAMVFGMLPIAMALSKGAEIRAPMAIAVIGGVLTSTVLTLVVVPVVFSLFEAARRRLGFKATMRETAPGDASAASTADHATTPATE
jgi:HAE1 family hydrophobic/amphiphilic exporter-1